MFIATFILIVPSRFCVTQLAGAVILGVGIWVKVDSSSLLGILEKVKDAPPQLSHLTSVGYLLIAVGAFLLIIGFLGCCGAVRESRCMLLTVSRPSHLGVTSRSKLSVTPRLLTVGTCVVFNTSVETMSDLCERKLTNTKLNYGLMV